MNPKIIYSDKRIEITNDQILFRNYYYPFSSKQVSFSQVEKVMVKEPTLWNGKWRIYGTGDFKTWFPFDGSRARRDKIFIMTLKDKWWRIGFTTENSDAIIDIFRNKNLLSVP